MMRVIVSLLLLSTPLSMQAGGWTWARRSAQVLACAASAADGYTSQLPGVYEQNPLLVNPKTGHISIPLMLATKIPACVAPIALSEWQHRKYHADVTEKVGFSAAAIESLMFSGLAIRNREIGNAATK